MGAYTNLKNAIKQVIKQNGNQEITGQLLQNTLLSMVDTLGTDYKYCGIATPTTVPSAEEGNIYYFAKESGSYTNFTDSAHTNLHIIDEQGLYVFTKNAETGWWSSENLVSIANEFGYATDKAISQNLASIKGANCFVQLIGNFKLTSPTSIIETTQDLYSINGKKSKVSGFSSYVIDNLSIENNGKFIKFKTQRLSDRFSNFTVVDSNDNVVYTKALSTPNIYYLAYISQGYKAYIIGYDVETANTISVADIPDVANEFGYATDKAISQNLASIKGANCFVQLIGNFKLTSPTSIIETTQDLYSINGKKSKVSGFSSYVIDNLSIENNGKFIKFKTQRLSDRFSNFTVVDSNDNVVYTKALSTPNIYYLAYISQGYKAYIIGYDVETANTISVADIPETFKNKWESKKIVWYGTSIPAYGYPLLCAQALNASCINESVGSSMARAGKINADLDNITGDTYGHNGVAWQNVCFSMCLSQKEKLYIFNNWTTERRKANLKLQGYSDDTLSNVKGYSEIMGGNFYGEATDETSIDNPTSKPKDIMLDNYKEFRKKCYADSYDSSIDIEAGFGKIDGKVDKYLTDDNFPDLFVLDHGHNDLSSSNIKDIPSDYKNRFYFIGAMNFIIDRILSFRPHARFLIISQYDYASYFSNNVVDAQKILASYWNIPICNISDAFQMNRSRKIRTNAYFDTNNQWHDSGYTGDNGNNHTNTSTNEKMLDMNGSEIKDSNGKTLYTHEINMIEAYMPDGLHPGYSKTNNFYGNYIANWINSHIIPF